MERLLRRPTPTGNIQLTDRDKLWIRAAHRFRFITTDQAQLLADAKSRNKLNDRLRDLWGHGYLERPEVQKHIYSYGDKRHVVHALGQRGAEFLAEHDGVRFPAGKGFKTTNVLKSPERLEHRIGLVDAVLHFDRAAAAAPGLRVIHQDELLAVSDWPPRLKPHRLPTQIRNKGSLVDRGTDPDYTFALGKTVDDEEKRALFFLEWDNSTEDYVKTNRLASSIVQKHECYADAYRRKLHNELYGFGNFRVLFVVNGAPERVMKMQHVYERRMQGSVPGGIFLYTTMDELEGQGPFAPIWLNGNRERVTILG